MKQAIFAALALLTCGLCCGPAAAKDLPAGGLTIEELSNWAHGIGLTPQIQTGANGAQTLLIVTDKSRWHIAMDDCKKNGRCGSLIFSIGLSTKGAFSAAQINAWNRSNRWARAYLDEENDPWLDYDVDLSPGGTYEGLNDQFTIWRDSLTNFRKFLAPG